MDFIKENERIYQVDENKELLCEITFPIKNGVADIDHTFVSDRLRGQGMADKLVTAAVLQIEEAGLKLTTTCSYAAKWMEKHPEKANLLFK